MYFTNDFFEATGGSNTTRWYNNDDEELEDELKEVLKKQEELASKVVMNSSESEVENEREEIVENKNYHRQPDLGSLSEEEWDKKRAGKVDLLRGYATDFRPCAVTNPDAKSSSDDSERIKKYCFYLTSLEAKNQPSKAEITIDKFKSAVAGIISPSCKITQARYGLLVTVNKLSDVEKIVKTDFPKIFGVPVQIANISENEAPYKHQVLFRTIPWIITLKELRYCLERQGIRYGKIKRHRNTVKVEVLNANHKERLFKEGLNFYNAVSFVASPDIPKYVDRCKTKEVIQCYKCQGFWHTATNCKNEVRCVRCGDHHEVEKCKKPKNSPLCCNCNGNHHAAYKLCPSRIQMMGYINLSYRTVPRKPNFLTASCS